MRLLYWVLLSSLVQISLQCDQNCKVQCDRNRQDFSCYEKCGCDTECEKDCRDLCLFHVPPNRLFTMCLIECGCQQLKWLTTLDTENLNTSNFEVVKHEVSKEQQVDTHTSTHTEYAKGTTQFEDQEVKRVVSDTDKYDTATTQTNKSTFEDRLRSNQVIKQETKSSLSSTVEDDSQTKTIFRNNTAQKQREENTKTSTEQVQTSNSEQETLANKEKIYTEGSKTSATSTDSKVFTEFQEDTVQLMGSTEEAVQKWGIKRKQCLAACILKCGLGVEGCLQHCGNKCDLDDEEDDDEQGTVSDIPAEQQQKENTSSQADTTAPSRSQASSSENEESTSGQQGQSGQSESSNLNQSEKSASRLSSASGNNDSKLNQVEGVNVTQVSMPNSTSKSVQQSTDPLSSSQLLLSSASVQVAPVPATSWWLSTLSSICTLAITLVGGYLLVSRYLYYRNRKIKDRIRRIKNETYILSSDMLLYKRL